MNVSGAEWRSAARDVVGQGWVQFERVLDAATCQRLGDAAPDNWTPEPAQIGDVRQRGLRAGLVFDACAAPVQELGETIRSSLNRCLPNGTTRAPAFNTVTWGRTDGGSGYITAHRDPPTAGGAIVVVTLVGRATFRIWRDDEATEWETAGGDVVIIRGTGWPRSGSLCPLHEAHALDEHRVTLTLRHNIRGAGAEYF